MQQSAQNAALLDKDRQIEPQEFELILEFFNYT